MVGIYVSFVGMMVVYWTTGRDYLCIVCLYKNDVLEYIVWVFMYHVLGYEWWDGIRVVGIDVSWVEIIMVDWNTGSCSLCIVCWGTCGWLE